MVSSSMTEQNKTTFNISAMNSDQLHRTVVNASHQPMSAIKSGQFFPIQQLNQQPVPTPITIRARSPPTAHIVSMNSTSNNIGSYISMNQQAQPLTVNNMVSSQTVRIVKIDSPLTNYTQKQVENSPNQILNSMKLDYQIRDEREQHSADSKESIIRIKQDLETKQEDKQPTPILFKQGTFSSSQISNHRPKTQGINNESNIDKIDSVLTKAKQSDDQNETGMKKVDHIIAKYKVVQGKPYSNDEKPNDKPFEQEIFNLQSSFVDKRELADSHNNFNQSPANGYRQSGSSQTQTNRPVDKSDQQSSTVQLV